MRRRRYDAKNGSFYLVRPDQHVAARWRSSMRRGPPTARPARPVTQDEHSHDTELDPNFRQPGTRYFRDFRRATTSTSCSSRRIATRLTTAPPSTRLIPLLANHIGDIGILREALERHAAPEEGGTQHLSRGTRRL